MSDVRASVVLAVRNGERTIGRAIESILAQSVAQLELIVIDDGSTDTTMDVVSGFADSRIRVLRTEPKGLSAALRLGIAEAKSDIIARQDADDASYPMRLERQLEIFDRRPEVVVVGVDWDERDGTGCRTAPTQALRPR